MKETAIKLAMNAVDLLNDEYKKSSSTSIARTRVEEYVTNRAKFFKLVMKMLLLFLIILMLLFIVNDNR